MGTKRAVHIKHERLWAEECLRLNDKLRAMSSNALFEDLPSTESRCFQGVAVQRLLNEEERVDLRVRSSAIRNPLCDSV